MASSRSGRKTSAIAQYFTPLPPAAPPAASPAAAPATAPGAAPASTVTALIAGVCIPPATPPLAVAPQPALAVALPPPAPASRPRQQPPAHQSPVTPAAPPDRADRTQDVPTPQPDFDPAVAAATAVDAAAVADFVEIEIPPVPLDDRLATPDADDCDASREACDIASPGVVLLSDSPGRPGKRSRRQSSPPLPPPSPPPPQPPQKLHSFFTSKPPGCRRAAAATAVPDPAPPAVNLLAERAIAQSRERAVERAAKRRRPRAAAVDPWEASPAATVHINAPVPALHEPSIPDERCCGREGQRTVLSTSSLKDQFWAPPFCESGERGKEPPAITNRQSSSSTLWSDDARDEGIDEVDVVNRKHVASLENWLRPFYAKKRKRGIAVSDDEGGNSEDESSDGDGVYHFQRDNCSDDGSCDEFGTENVCLVTGEVGCGKSTVVRQAAARLKLTILEINSMRVRSGKRVKDAVSEALATHRIASGKRQNSSSAGTQNAGFNTLIVFEEVDHLTEDDRGFWGAIADLSAVAGARRPIILTANHVTPDMCEVFGDFRCETMREITRLMGRNDPSELGDPLLCRFKHIAIPRPSAKAVYNTIQAVARAKGVSIDRVSKRVITGLYSQGDCRGAINALQFWSIPGIGCAASDGIAWARDREGASCEPFTEGAALFRSLQILDSKIRLPSKSAATLACWAETLDVFSEVDASSSDPCVEKSALRCLNDVGMDVSDPDCKDPSSASFFYSQAYLRTITPAKQISGEVYPRGPATSRQSHNTDIRGNIRRMTSLELEARASSGGDRGRSRRTTRSATILRPSPFSRLSDEALSILFRDEKEIPKPC